MPISKLFNEFFESERASGIVLLGCTVLSIAVANTPAGSAYISLWHARLGFDLAWIHLNHTIEYWINDGLMAIFFLLIGLEIERELYVGKLSNLKNASLPIFAAIGGMAIPASVPFLAESWHGYSAWHRHSDGHRYCVCLGHPGVAG